jgi:tetratricopeptide (TPR) repeat protein
MSMKFFRASPYQLALVLPLGLGLDAAALTAQEAFTASSGSVVALEFRDDNGQVAGSGTATSLGGRNFVSTCDGLDKLGTYKLHIVTAATTGTRTSVAKIKARDHERNLCLIEADAASQGLAQQRQPPQTGSRVYAVSNALGMGVGISEGIVSGVRHFPTGDYIQFTAPISPGSEGGALLDEQGRLLGIIDYQRRDGQNVNFASFVAWTDDIATRAAANAENLARIDAGNAMAKQQNWQGLSAFAANWLKQQADNPDALKFAVAASQGLKDGPAELLAWSALHRVQPALAEVGVGLGRALLQEKKTKEALDLAKQLTTQHPEYAQAVLLLAHAQLQAGMLKETEESYRQAVALDPRMMESYQGMAILAQQRGDTKTAISIWLRLSGLFPNSAVARYGLVRAYLAADQAGRAYTILESLPENERDSADAWYWRGSALRKLDAPEQSVAAYRKCLERPFQAPDTAWAGIGYAMKTMERYPEAIEAFDMARKINPQEDSWTFQQVINLKDGGRPEEALAMIMPLVTKEPGNSEYQRQHGLVLAVLARPAEAIAPIHRSLQLNPEQPRLWRALIETYDAAGRYADAQEAYQKLRAIDTSWAEGAYRNAILPYEESKQ